jgi:hypothetical protein
MQETENFKRIYCYSPVEKDDIISIDENRGSAKIRHLNIFGGGTRFTLIEEDHCDKVGGLFRKESQCKRNADGVILYDGINGKTLILCELKSSCGGVFKSAYQQAFASYIKTCMQLSLCEGFDINNYNVHFLFTAQKGVELDMTRNELEEIDDRDFLQESELCLLKGENVRFPMNSVPHDISFLHSDYISKEVECRLLTSDNDTIDFDISSL